MSDQGIIFNNREQIIANLSNFQTTLQALITANATGLTFTPAQTLQLAMAVNGLIDLVTGALSSTTST